MTQGGKMEIKCLFFFLLMILDTSPIGCLFFPGVIHSDVDLYPKDAYLFTGDNLQLWVKKKTSDVIISELIIRFTPENALQFYTNVTVFNDTHGYIEILAMEELKGRNTVSVNGHDFSSTIVRIESPLKGVIHDQTVLDYMQKVIDTTWHHGQNYSHPEELIVSAVWNANASPTNSSPSCQMDEFSCKIFYASQSIIRIRFSVELIGSRKDDYLKSHSLNGTASLDDLKKETEIEVKPHKLIKPVIQGRINTHNVTSSSVTLSWLKSDGTEHFDYDLQYEIHFKNPSHTVPTKGGVIAHGDQDGKTVSLDMNGFEPDTKYEGDLRVKPNSSGYWSEEKSFEFTTKEARPDRSPHLRPTSFSVGDCDSEGYRDVTIYWNEQPKQDINGKLTGYLVEFLGVKDSISSRANYLSHKALCNATFNFTMTSQTLIGSALESSVLTLPREEEALKLNSKLNFKIVFKEKGLFGNSTITISWASEHPQDTENMTMVIYFCDGSSLIRGCKGDFNVTEVPFNNKGVELSISPDIDLFGSALSTASRVTGITWTDCIYDLDLVPVKPKGVVAVTGEVAGSLRISWDAKQCSKQDRSLVTEYLVKICPESVSKQCINRTVHGNVVVVESLEPDQLYHATVQGISRTHAGTKVGPQSDPVFEKTKGESETRSTEMIAIPVLLVIIVMIIITIFYSYKQNQRIKAHFVFEWGSNDLESAIKEKKKHQSECSFHNGIPDVLPREKRRMQSLTQTTSADGPFPVSSRNPEDVNTGDDFQPVSEINLDETETSEYLHRMPLKDQKLNASASSYEGSGQSDKSATSSIDDEHNLGEMSGRHLQDSNAFGLHNLRDVKEKDDNHSENDKNLEKMETLSKYLDRMPLETPVKKLKAFPCSYEGSGQTYNRSASSSADYHQFVDISGHSLQDSNTFGCQALKDVQKEGDYHPLCDINSDKPETLFDRLPLEPPDKKPNVSSSPYERSGRSESSTTASIAGYQHVEEMNGHALQDSNPIGLHTLKDVKEKNDNHSENDTNVDEMETLSEYLDRMPLKKPVKKLKVSPNEGSGQSDNSAASSSSDYYRFGEMNGESPPGSNALGFQTPKDIRKDDHHLPSDNQASNSNHQSKEETLNEYLERMVPQPANERDQGNQNGKDATIAKKVEQPDGCSIVSSDYYQVGEINGEFPQVSNALGFHALKDLREDDHNLSSDNQGSIINHQSHEETLNEYLERMVPQPANERDQGNQNGKDATVAEKVKQPDGYPIVSSDYYRFGEINGEFPQVSNALGSYAPEDLREDDHNLSSDNQGRNSNLPKEETLDEYLERMVPKPANERDQGNQNGKDATIAEKVKQPDGRDFSPPFQREISKDSGVQSPCSDFSSVDSNFKDKNELEQLHDLEESPEYLMKAGQEHDQPTVLTHTHFQSIPENDYIDVCV